MDQRFGLGSAGSSSAALIWGRSEGCNVSRVTAARWPPVASLSFLSTGARSWPDLSSWSSPPQGSCAGFFFWGPGGEQKERQAPKHKYTPHLCCRPLANTPVTQAHHSRAQPRGCRKRRRVSLGGAAGSCCKGAQRWEMLQTTCHRKKDEWNTALSSQGLSPWGQPRDDAGWSVLARREEGRKFPHLSIHPSPVSAAPGCVPGTVWALGMPV